MTSSSLFVALETGRLDHRPPFGALLLLEVGEACRRAAHRIEADLQQALSLLGLGQDAGELLAQDGDDGLWRTARRIERNPARRLEARHALLGHGLEPREQLAGRGRRDVTRPAPH